MSTNKKENVSKGINSLLKNIENNSRSTIHASINPEIVNTVRISVTLIETNPKQPRKDFEEDALQELVKSIKIHDIIQPLTVSKIPGGKYQLIAGERRLRAAKIAELKTVPAYIRQANDQQMLEWALLENLQRTDLNAIEVGLSYRRMMEELNFTQEQVAERMGKDRSTVTNFIRLLRLPPSIQLALRKNDLSTGHARAIIAIDNIEKQLFVFKEIISKHLSVRQTEEFVRSLNTLKTKNQNISADKKETTSFTLHYEKTEKELSSIFDTKVTIQVDKNNKGSISLAYNNIEEFNKLLDHLKK
ncbi:MAG: ParB/RepB/Spo0J family partition protein [Chitinophagaceae bacterium]